MHFGLNILVFFINSTRSATYALNYYIVHSLVCVSLFLVNCAFPQKRSDYRNIMFNLSNNFILCVPKRTIQDMLILHT